MIIPITDFVQSTIVKKIELELVQYNLNTSAVCNVNYLDNENKKIDSVLVTIEGNEFSTEWVNDEDLINIVCRKLGFVVIPN